MKRYRHPMLTTLFSPTSVAIIGASSVPGKLGYDIVNNLVNSDFTGNIFPVNPKGEKIMGLQSYPDVLAIPNKIDLAVIAIPARFVRQVVEQCAQKKIQNIVIISAGFKETGKEGAAEEKKIQEIARKHHMSLVGPNCLGIVNTYADMNASFAEGMPKQGNIALVSQSGAMAVAITDWAYEQNIGFSKIVSLGNKAGIDENDCLDFLCEDAQTDVIMMYLESFADGRKFMKLATTVAQKKPIIVFKSGTSEAGTQAVLSHTGSLSGTDTAVEAALRQCGVIRAETMEDFFDLARMMSMQPLPSGNCVAIVTNAGGPGVIATDALSRSSLLQMAAFSEETSQKLQQLLPPAASIHNPVDVIGDALADRYEAAFETLTQDENVHMILGILTPQVMTEKEKTAHIIEAQNSKHPNVVFCTSFIGGRNTKHAVKDLEHHNIPNFLYPTRAVRAMEAMVWLADWRKKQKSDEKIHKIPRAGRKISLRGKKGQLETRTTEKLLRQYAIHTPEMFLAQSPEEAVVYAEKIGYPVVLKISSGNIIHKTDVGGIRLALKNSHEVKRGFQEILYNIQLHVPDADVLGILVQKMYHFGREVIVGMKNDPVFGPLIMFGLGGVYVEVMKDVSFRVAPFALSEAEKMIHEIKAIQLLKGVRGEAGSDITSLTHTIMSVAQLALDYPEIQELDLNPLLALQQGAVAVDARIILQ